MCKQRECSVSQFMDKEALCGCLFAYLDVCEPCLHVLAYIPHLLVCKYVHGLRASYTLTVRACMTKAPVLVMSDFSVIFFLTGE